MSHIDAGQNEIKWRQIFWQEARYETEDWSNGAKFCRSADRVQVMGVVELRGRTVAAHSRYGR